MNVQRKWTNPCRICLKWLSESLKSCKESRKPSIPVTRCVLQFPALSSLRLLEKTWRSLAVPPPPAPAPLYNSAAFVQLWDIGYTTCCSCWSQNKKWASAQWHGPDWAGNCGVGKAWHSRQSFMKKRDYFCHFQIKLIVSALRTQTWYRSLITQQFKVKQKLGQ